MEPQKKCISWCWDVGSMNLKIDPILMKYIQVLTYYTLGKFFFLFRLLKWIFSCFNDKNLVLEVVIQFWSNIDINQLIYLRFITYAIITLIIATLTFAPISYLFEIHLQLIMCVRVLLTICRFSVGPETRVWHYIPQRCQSNCSNAPHKWPLNLRCRNVSFLWFEKNEDMTVLAQIL